MGGANGTCDALPSSPDLAGWAIHPTFTAIPPSVYPYADVAAHAVAVGLVDPEGLDGSALPCAVSFQGGVAPFTHDGTCTLADVGAVPAIPPPCAARHVQGGACSHASQAPGGLAGMAVVLAASAIWRRVAPAALVALALLHGDARADDVLLPMGVEPGPWRTVHPLDAIGAWTVHGRIVGDWQHRPVVVVRPDGTGAPLVDGVATLSAAVGVDLFGAVRATVGLPVHVAVAGRASSEVDASLVPVPVAPGDAALQLRANLTRAGPHQVGVAVRLDVPTSPGAPWTSGTSFAADVVWASEVRWFSVSAQLGVLTARPGAPTALSWAGGLRARWTRLSVGVEANGQVGVPRARDAGVDLVAGPWTPALASLQVGVQVVPGVHVRALGGVGLHRGLGTPTWEAALLVDVSSQAPVDLDGDGLVGAADRCPRRPEDFDGTRDGDGCPDPDNDDDGITDVQDACPDVPEDLDGVDDDDGCPEWRAVLHVTVTPEAPDRAETIEAWIGDGPHARSPGDAVLEVPVPRPGWQTLHVVAPGHVPAAVPVRVPDPADQRSDVHVSVTVPLALPVWGMLALDVRDAQGAPITAWWRDGDRMETAVDGHWDGRVTAGAHTLVVGAPGHVDRTVPLTVAPDDTTAAEVRLLPALAWLDDGQVVLDRALRFDVDANEPVAADESLLDALADVLRAHPELELVRVEGHADGSGTSRHNYDLSVARATAVRDALVARGITASRLVVVGSGEARAGERAVTRTVEFVPLVWADPAVSGPP